MEQLILLFWPPFLPFSVRSWHYLQVLANLVPEELWDKAKQEKNISEQMFQLQILEF